MCVGEQPGPRRILVQVGLNKWVKGPASAGPSGHFMDSKLRDRVSRLADSLNYSYLSKQFICCFLTLNSCIQNSVLCRTTSTNHYFLIGKVEKSVTVYLESQIWKLKTTFM